MDYYNDLLPTPEETGRNRRETNKTPPRYIHPPPFRPVVNPNRMAGGSRGRSPVDLAPEDPTELLVAAARYRERFCIGYTEKKFLDISRAGLLKSAIAGGEFEFPFTADEEELYTNLLNGIRCHIYNKRITAHGRVSTINILLREPRKNDLANSALLTNLLNKEIMIRGKMFGEASEILGATGNDSPMWAGFYGTYMTKIVLEDLEGLGKETERMKKYLDFEHALQALQTMGRFHAMTVSLMGRGWVNQDVLSLNIFEDKRDMFALCFSTAIEELRKEMAEENKVYVEFLRKYEDIGFGEIYRSFDRYDTRFNVLNIGDFSTGNLYFEYSKGGNSPTGLRFLDFQLCFFTTYGLDLVYFLITSVENPVREERLDELLQGYLDSLVENLEKMGCIEEYRPETLEDIKQELRRLEGWAVFVTTVLLPTLRPPKGGPNLSFCVNKWNQSATVVVPRYRLLGEEYKETVKSVLNMYINKSV